MTESGSGPAGWFAATFRAMGTNCRVVAPDGDLAHRAVALVGELEQMWSRFLPDSEIAQLNRSAGRLCVVSAVTFELIARAEQARAATDGAFNPLMLDQLVTLGYDTTWDDVTDVSSDPPPVSPGSDQPIELFDDAMAVRLPEGTSFDPGGIGKGLAGDLVAAALLDDGAGSVQVELGGDVRVAGRPWSASEWQVQVDDTDHGAAVAATISLAEGGVATSSVVRRRWRRGDVEVHHLLDPSTGFSATTDLDAVTAVAPTLWWAEVVAKVALMAGSNGARSVFDRYDMSGLLVRSAAPQRYETIPRRGVTP
ncbi:MAG TPA: FAD:protein FMN transferase [Ilumatobacteraceae bacterium]|nr:FAD:protein FMN transferase [Ilumatobacteraceae bacterium]